MEGKSLWCSWNHLHIDVNEITEDDILDDEDINIDYDEFIDEDVLEGNVQELKDLSSPEDLTHLHPAKNVACNFNKFIKDCITTWFSVCNIGSKQPVIVYWVHHHLLLNSISY